MTNDPHFAENMGEIIEAISSSCYQTMIAVRHQPVDDSHDGEGGGRQPVLPRCFLTSSW